MPGSEADAGSIANRVHPFTQISLDLPGSRHVPARAQDRWSIGDHQGSTQSESIHNLNERSARCFRLPSQSSANSPVHIREIQSRGLNQTRVGSSRLPITLEPMAQPSRKQSNGGRTLATSATQRKLPVEEAVQEALDWLRHNSSKATREGMARYGIPSERAFGVSMSNIQMLAKRLGRNHELAGALWNTGWYEARLLASYVDDPACVTPAQMDRWCRDFDNWAVCDTVCFALFDRTPHAWRKVEQWCGKRDEFVKRAAFALLWGLTVHDKGAADALFVQGLRLVERAAADKRHFVMKAVNMALRAIGKRNSALHAEAVTVAQRLAASTQAAERWVGKDAIRELTSPNVIKRLRTRRAAGS